MYNNYNPYYPFMYQMGNGTMQDNVSQIRNQQIQPQLMPQAQNQNNNGFVWVQGEAGAKSYIVAPGSTVMLMDSEGERFFLKSADASGMPLPLRIFDYKERTEMPSQAVSAPVSAQNVNFDNFVTREEFEQRMASIASQCQCKNKGKKNNLTEDATDGE